MNDTKPTTNDLLTYQVKQDPDTKRFYVTLWNDDRIVTDFGEYRTFSDAMDGANNDSQERQGCYAPPKR